MAALTNSAFAIIQDLGLGIASAQVPKLSQLLARMDRGEVGVRVVRDITRLGRSYLELALFSLKAIRNEVSIAVGGRFYRPSAKALCRLFGLRFPLTLAGSKRASA